MGNYFDQFDYLNDEPSCARQPELSLTLSRSNHFDNRDCIMLDTTKSIPNRNGLIANARRKVYAKIIDGLLISSNFLLTVARDLSRAS